MISVKSDKVRSQNLIQSRRQPHISSSSPSSVTMIQEQALQEWQYQNGLLKLKAFPDYNLVSLYYDEKKKTTMGFCSFPL